MAVFGQGVVQFYFRVGGLGVRRNGGDTALPRARVHAEGLPHVKQPSDSLGLPQSCSRERTVPFRLGPGGAGLGLGVAHHQQRPRVQLLADVGCHQVLKRRNITGVAQQGGGFFR
ncbi:hypothetical protein D9M72_356130 [compost metagenome]